jgi:hypothetical protein
MDLIWERRGNARRLVAVKTAGQKLLQSPRRRWEFNINMYLKEQEGVVWTEFMWIRVRTSNGLL